MATFDTSDFASLNADGTVTVPEAWPADIAAIAAEFMATLDAPVEDSDGEDDLAYREQAAFGDEGPDDDRDIGTQAEEQAFEQALDAFLAGEADYREQRGYFARRLGDEGPDDDRDIGTAEEEAAFGAALDRFLAGERADDPFYPTTECDTCGGSYFVPDNFVADTDRIFCPLCALETRREQIAHERAIKRTIRAAKVKDWSAKADSDACAKCDGSGIYWGKTMTAQGPTPTPGTCYACKGTGQITQQDAFRNATYWAKYARISG